MKARFVSIAVVLIFSTSIACSVKGVFFDDSLSDINYDTGVDRLAVLLEMNDFPEGWSDLPVGFINSQRMQTALFSLGWENDSIYPVKGNLSMQVVQEAVEWLSNSTDSDDIELL